MSTSLWEPAGPRKRTPVPGSTCSPEVPPRQRRLLASGLTKAAAEAVLDWLEAYGHRDCQVTYVPGEGFMIAE
jgi:hypothetical protein